MGDSGFQPKKYGRQAESYAYGICGGDTNEFALHYGAYESRCASPFSHAQTSAFADIFTIIAENPHTL